MVKNILDVDIHYLLSIPHHPQSAGKFATIPFTKKLYIKYNNDILYGIDGYYDNNKAKMNVFISIVSEFFMLYLTLKIKNGIVLEDKSIIIR